MDGVDWGGWANGWIDGVEWDGWIDGWMVGLMDGVEWNGMEGMGVMGCYEKEGNRRDRVQCKTLHVT